MGCNKVKFIKWALCILFSLFTPRFLVNLITIQRDPLLNLELENLYREHGLSLMNNGDGGGATGQKVVPDAPPSTVQIRELKIVQDYIYDRLDKLQNDGNCADKKIIRCSNSLLSGFGSTIHRHVICLHIALALNRTFFIDQPQFATFNGLANFTRLESGKCGYLKRTLHSITDRCDFNDINCYIDKDGWQINNRYKLLEFTQEAKFPAPRYIPGTLPKIMRERLEVFGIKNTWHWFTAQLLGYMILRPDGLFKQKYETYLKQTPLRFPMVGMHVRVTDKLHQESRYIPLQAYIEKVNNIFEKQLKVNGTRYIYVASDDSRTIRKVRQAFTGHDYVILGNPLSHELRYIGRRRDDSPDVMEKILMDLYVMSHCSYNVVTFSSNVGRLIWELKTSLYPYTESETVVSMDIPKIFYAWYAYEVTKYYLTIRDHEKEVTINGITIISYKKGMIFHRHGSNWVQKIKGTDVTVKRLRSKGRDSKVGFVYDNDIKEWPGNVDYINDL